MADCYLASRSSRRRELLAQIGVDFSVLNVDVLEERQAEELGLAYVQRLAREKAQAGSVINTEKPVMGADTIVMLDDQILEKPKSQQHAIEMLCILSNRRHHVITAVAISFAGQTESCHCITEVSFRVITETEAIRYWQTGEPQDKAGAYGIQGLGAVFVEHIQGSYSNVVGLPLYETTQLLKHFEIPIWKN